MLLQFIDELKEELRRMRFQKRPSLPLPTKGKSEQVLPAPAHKPPLQMDWDEKPCCILLSKPLDKVLIR